MKYSIIIPVYNSESTLKELTQRIGDTMDKLKEAYEIIFIDDASGDRSWERIVEIKKSMPCVKAIRLAANFGQHNALMCGFNHSRGRYVITLDDDLQHLPEEIPLLIEKAQEGYDLVYGQYRLKKHNFFRNLGTRFIAWVYRRTLRVKGGITSFRLIRAEVAKDITGYDKNYTFIDGLIAWRTKNIAYVTVEHRQRKEGRSGYNLRKLFVLTMNLVTNFSILPLQVASFLGIIFSGVGFIMAVVYFCMKLFSQIVVSGFTTIIIAVMFFAGVQLLILGMIGEYLGRIQLNINSKPQYYIKERIE
ncbi:MAG: glycosyltransferase family 2 protein [Candidatus Omnitrophica bacterium]|nr:glycosyltransferase family 2 protein [Candidatus Omnitrophota bacterium]